jgi:hypothetical protein
MMRVNDCENSPVESKLINQANINHRNCLYCNEPFTEELWCKECDPFRMIEGWTSGNPNVDKFIKNTMYSVRNEYYNGFFEWVSSDRFTDIKEIGEGGFAKVYSATWIDGVSKYYVDDDGNWKKEDPTPMKVTLKRLNGSQNMPEKYLNEVYFCYINNYLFILYFIYNFYYKYSLKHIGNYLN